MSSEGFTARTRACTRSPEMDQDRVPDHGSPRPFCCKCPGPKHARLHHTRTMPRNHAAPVGRLLAKLVLHDNTLTYLTYYNFSALRTH